MNKIYFISGASGVGKTTVMKELKKTLPEEQFDIHDFDERGVPDNAGHDWRIEETKYWINLGDAIAKEGKSLVVCGLSNPDEMLEFSKEINTPVETILLDAKPEIIENRLRSRNQDEHIRKDLERAACPVEEFTKNNTNFAIMLRKICDSHGCRVIDTSEILPEIVAERVAESIKDIKIK